MLQDLLGVLLSREGGCLVAWPLLLHLLGVLPFDPLRALSKHLAVLDRNDW